MTLVLPLAIAPFLACFVLAGSHAGEAQTRGPASLVYDRTLLQEATRFGALTVAFPKACSALPDSLRQLTEDRANQARRHEFQYEIEHFCGFVEGHALVFSRIVDQEPSADFAFLAGYEPVEGLSKEDLLQVRSMYSGAVALREYSFERSGFMVRQVFVQSPEAVYQLDVLIRRAWTEVMVKTYESVLSSIHITL